MLTKTLSFAFSGARAIWPLIVIFALLTMCDARDEVMLKSQREACAWEPASCQ